MPHQPSPAAGPLPELLRDVGGGGGGGYSWVLAGALFSFLTLNSGMAVYHSKGDAAIVAFVAASYLDLVLLFFCVWLYKRAPRGSPLTNRLKASVWVTTTLLTFCFAYMVVGTGTAGLTLPVALQVWVVAVATGVAAFSTFFDQDQERTRINQPRDETMLSTV